eukprot:1195314-Alexandrium_andersonii.AAC.1
MRRARTTGQSPGLPRQAGAHLQRVVQCRVAFVARAQLCRQRRSERTYEPVRAQSGALVKRRKWESGSQG